jgi:hypothetical protein
MREETASARWHRARAEAAAIAFIAFIAWSAKSSGMFYLMFPELAALCFDVFARPRGVWARAPLYIAITPPITGVIGIIVTRTLPYGMVSVLIVVGCSIGVILAMRSPVAPAISAGLLPLVLGVKSWMYPPGILFGTGILAILSIAWNRVATDAQVMEGAETIADDSENVIESEPQGYSWFIALMLFVAGAAAAVELTGLRFILFPPLIVIGFEMFGHPARCPWARRPIIIPIACFLTAAGGLMFLKLFGVGPLAAASSMAWGIAVLRVLDLHVPPALAVALLPQVMVSPTFAYPISVAAGTAMMSAWFMAYRRYVIENSAPSENAGVSRN